MAVTFKPRRPGDTVGGRLTQMWMQGRPVISQQRARWQRSRAMYRGDQYIQPGISSGNLRSLAPTLLLPDGRRRDTVNRTAQLVDARVSMLTKEQPPYEVRPPGYNQDQVDGARMASKLIDYEWDNPQGWAVAEYLKKAALWAEQDGITIGHVYYDPTAKPEVYVPVEPDPRTGRPAPISDPGRLAALRYEDPSGGTLWTEQPMTLGQIRFRNVRPGRFAVDPNLLDDWREASWCVEGRVRPRADVEAQYGVKIDDLRKQQRQRAGTGPTQFGADPNSEAPVTVADDYDGQDRRVPASEAVTVFEVFALKRAEFPNGAHVVWVQGAPEVPLLSEDYDDEELPYFVYCPRPDGGHLFRNRGTVEFLAPLQVRLNRLFSQIGEWMDLLARPPLIAQKGALVSQAVFNDSRLVEVMPGLMEPHFMAVPGEPAQVIAQHIPLVLEQMAELAIQNDVTRGTPPGQGMTAGVSLAMLTQQNEQQFAGTESEFVGFIQRSVRRGLKLVIKHYDLPRMVATPGVDDESEFVAFTGDKLRGCTDYRVTASILPTNRAQRLSMLIQVMQYSHVPFDPTPWLGTILAGDVQPIITHSEAQERRQERENRQMAALGRSPQRDEIWTNFTQMRDAYMQQVAMLGAPQATQVPGMPAQPVQNPQAALASQGVQPPRVIDMLRQAGLPVPTVQPYDRHAEHLMRLDDWSISDGFEAVHPLVAQVAREHRLDHVAGLAQQAQALTQQTSDLQPPQPAPAPQPSAGVTKLIESLNYKDTPPDIQRQIESAAGFEPSEAPLAQHPTQPQQPNGGAGGRTPTRARRP